MVSNYIGNGNVLLMFVSISGTLALIVLLLAILTSNSTLALVQSSPSIGNSNNISRDSSSAAPNFNATKLMNSKLEKIESLSNVIGASTVDGIQVSAINVGDTDLTVTLKHQITTNATNTANNNASNISLPVTVIAAKLPITNLPELTSAVESSSGSTMATGSTTNSMATAPEQPGSNTATQSNAFQKLSLLKKIQIGAASIVNANWTLPQTVSMGFLGLGSTIGAYTPSDFTLVLVVVVPFQSESGIATLQM